MGIRDLVERLKQSLPLTSNAYDALLTQYLQTAIDKFGACIDTEEDKTLVILYAAWLWRSQRDPGLAKPPALVMAINDRAVRRIGN